MTKVIVEQPRLHRVCLKFLNVNIINFAEMDKGGGGNAYQSKVDNLPFFFWNPSLNVVSPYSEIRITPDLALLWGDIKTNLNYFDEDYKISRTLC